MQIEILSIEEAKNHWLTFQKDALLYAFQTYEWLSLWYKYIGKNQKVITKIAIIRDGGTIIAVLPFGIYTRHHIKCLSWLGGDVTDYHGPILSPIFSWDQRIFFKFWNALLSKAEFRDIDVILLEKQPEIIGESKNPFVFLSQTPFRAHAHYAVLNGNWESYFKNHKKAKHRADSRRQLKKLKEQGSVAFSHITAPDKAHFYIRHLIDQKSARYKEIGARDAFKNELIKNFYQNVIPALLSKKLAHLSALTVNETPIALHFGLLHRKRFYYLIPSFKGGLWRRHSPGRLLMEHLIKWCFENDVKVFDLTIGDEEYKMSWRDRELKLYQYLEPLTIKGAIFCKYHRIITHLKSNKKFSAIASKILQRL